MVKTVANTVMLVGMIVIVTSVGAIALRLYSLACRGPRALGIATYPRAQLVTRHGQYAFSLRTSETAARPARLS
jgi:hypothetical protein